MKQTRNRVVSVRIRKLASGSYQLNGVDPATGKRVSMGVKRLKRDAERLKFQRMQELEQGTYHGVANIKFDEFVDRHIATIAGARDAKEAEWTLREFGRMTDVQDLPSIRYDLLEAYVLKLRKLKTKTGNPKNRPATINKKLTYLRTAMNRAIDRGYITRHEVKTSLWQKVNLKVPRTLTGDEQERLKTAAMELYGERWRVLIAAALDTGGRRGELMGLTWDRVCFERCRVHFTKTKGRKDRYVRFDPDLADALHRLKALTLADGGPFVGMITSMQKRWDKIVDQAEIVPRATFHDLRKTCCKDLIDAGTPASTVQAMLGHADLKTTLTYYNQVAEQDMENAIDRRYKLRKETRQATAARA